jgi:hypothetical protein
MKAIAFARLGLSEQDAIIREDSWLYAAVRIVKNHDERKAMDELGREAKREMRGAARMKR